MRENKQTKRPRPTSRDASAGVAPALASRLVGRGRLVCLFSRIKVKYLDDRAAADQAEAHFVARKHDAVGLRPVEAARLVIGALESADFAGKSAGAEQRRLTLHLLAEQRVHL